MKRHGQLAVSEMVFKQVESDESKREKTFVISAEVVDADCEVVVTKGIDFSNFRKNPVVLYMHSPWDIVGKSLWEKKRTVDGVGECIAKVQFTDTLIAREVWSQCEAGYLRGASIGCPWPSMKFRDCSKDDLKENPHWKGCHRIAEKSELREWSVVSIPSCPLALLEDSKKGLFEASRAVLEDPWTVEFFKIPRKHRVTVVEDAPAPLKLTASEKKVLTQEEAVRIVSRRIAHIKGRV